MPTAFPISPEFAAAFGSALTGTSKVFAVGAAGFWIVHRKWIPRESLTAFGHLVARLTLPCLVFTSFASGFDPARSPGWWKLAVISACITLLGLAFGKVMAIRHKNEEATMLVGYQNSGFFVLPLLQALLGPAEFRHASALLFVFVIPFNASLWPVGAWVVLKKREFNTRSLISPPTIATVAALIIYGLFHDYAHQFDNAMLVQILVGGHSPGALQLIGDITTPLATLILGGTVAAQLRHGTGEVSSKRAAVEVSVVKLVVLPLIGYALLRYCPFLNPTRDATLALLLMLEFAAPPGVNVAVFLQQHGYPAKLLPATCLFSYVACLITVPFWVALVPK